MQAQMQAQKIAQYVVERSDEGCTLEIDIASKGLRVGKALVQTISMYVTFEDNDGEYYDGDLAVNWDVDGLSNNEAAQTMGSLLMRDAGSDDEVTQVMRLFYNKKAFNNKLCALLQIAGFSAEAAASVDTSEWGMQDEGRASYDAADIAKEVRAAVMQLA